MRMIKNSKKYTYIKKMIRNWPNFPSIHTHTIHMHTLRRKGLIYVETMVRTGDLSRKRADSARVNSRKGKKVADLCSACFPPSGKMEIKKPPKSRGGRGGNVFKKSQTPSEVCLRIKFAESFRVLNKTFRHIS